MSTVEFDKRKYSTDSEYMIQNLKEQKNLEKWRIHGRCCCARNYMYLHAL